MRLKSLIFNLKSSDKGVSLYFAVIITSLFLAIVFGLTAILVSQTKIFKEIGDSATALFAADSGMEKILYLDWICQKENCASSTVNPNFYLLCQEQSISAGYTATSCIGLYNYTTFSAPAEFSISDLSYQANVTTTQVEGATTTFFRSKGIYKERQRTIEAGR